MRKTGQTVLLKGNFISSPNGLTHKKIVLITYVLYSSHMCCTHHICVVLIMYVLYSSHMCCSHHVCVVLIKYVVLITHVLYSSRMCCTHHICVKPYPAKILLSWTCHISYRLMEVKSIAECSKGSILQYFLPPLSYHFPLRPWFCLFLSDR